MAKNREDCRNQNVNYIDFLDKLVRCAELTRQEKVWNLFKNVSEESNEIESKSIQEHLILKGYKLNDEILADLKLNANIDFNGFLQLFDKHRLQIN